jgi:soluble lytic murein transglycosylase-like protein
MSFCLKLNLLVGCVGVCVLSDAAFAANLVKQTVIVPRVRSVVRADAKGRLVRTVVVTPRVIQPRQVEDSAPVTATAPDYSATVPQLVEAAAKKYDIDPLLVHSVIQVESNYNPYAVSPKGAQGLMQLMPGTARRFGVSNSFDPRENIEGGVRYLKYLSGLFPQDPRLALAAYNAGEGAVWKYNYQIPPYRETEQYVYKVARKYGQAKKASEQTRAIETAVAAPQPVTPGEPAYAPVRYFVDAEGKLHMQTPEASGQSGTP